MEQTKEEINTYISELNEHQQKAYDIAFNHLGSSFDIYKSNGFKKWKEQLIKQQINK